MNEEITLDDILWQLEKHPIDSDYVFGCKEVKIIYDSIIKLIKENQELKKQLENNSKINVSDHKYASTCEDKVIILETQQKEFIKYLEKRYKDVTSVIGSYGSNTDLLYGKKYMLEEILQKYKEIIGDDK